MGDELRGGLEKDREELRTKLRDATNEVRGQITLAECVFLPDEIYQIKLFIISGITPRCEVKVRSFCSLRSVGWSRRSSTRARKKRGHLREQPRALAWRKSSTRLGLDWLGRRRRRRGSGTDSRET